MFPPKADPAKTGQLVSASGGLAKEEVVRRGGSPLQYKIQFAVVVQLVERFLAKEEVAGSNPVYRSRNNITRRGRPPRRIYRSRKKGS